MYIAKAMMDKEQSELTQDNPKKLISAEIHELRDRKAEEDSHAFLLEYVH